MRFLLLIPILALPLLGAETPEQIEFFEKNIRPVLVEQCYQCHSAETMAMADLRLDTREATRRGGTRGPSVSPGDPANSMLLKAISYADLDLKMPPGGKLSAVELANFRQWVEMGAPDPRVEATEEAAEPARTTSAYDWDEARKFWAFQPVRKPPEPTVERQDQVATPVDAFLLARLEREGLEPAPLADRRTLIRRVTFDLIGLPPTLDEIEAFLADTAPNAYEKLVERLLASPHYGERWARHWLDLVRYAETNGHEFDNTKLDAWRYRDYVVRAYNQDLPYDRFVQEHIAGDLLPDPRLTPDGGGYDTPVASGFYWLWEVLNSPTDSGKARADQVDNQIDVFGKAFFGLTVACARCHDHKFDPIPTADYYALAGVMHSIHVSEKSLDSPATIAAIEAVRAELAALDRQADGVQGKVVRPALRDGDIVFEDFSDGFGRWDIAGAAFGSAPAAGAPGLAPLAGDLGAPLAHSAPAGANEFTGILTTEKFKIPSEYLHIRMAGSSEDRGRSGDAPIRVTLWADDHPSQKLIASSAETFQWGTVKLVKEQGRVGYLQIVDRSREGWIAVDRIVFSDHAQPPPDPASPAARPSPAPELLARRDAIAGKLPVSRYGMSSRDLEPHDVRVHNRGNHKNLGEEVPRRFLMIVAGEDQPPVREGSGRLELARWATSPQNPLTPRVMVNRIWKHHFGSGLVGTPDNFGKTGDRPTHPALLEWLAADFVERGWSIKQLHRRILYSTAYRRDSLASERSRDLDPENKLLSHMPVRRLEAEAIRDAILSVAGTLRLEMEGPSVPPHISAYQDGRGKPESGPLDGDGRRSLYIQPRRNFLPPLFLAFDYPQPFTTIGQRGVSAAPSQALILLNNELIHDQARKWAQREVEAVPDRDQRIAVMFERAFGRAPNARELRQVRAFLAQQAARHESEIAETAQWADLAHVLLNSAEFVFVR